MKKQIILRPFLAAARRIAPPRSPLRRKINSVLIARFPRLQARLKKMVRGPGMVSVLSTEAPRTARRHLPSKLHPLLAEPRLLTLDRPKAALLVPEHPGSLSGESLEPVIEMGQMRQTTASVCFVLPLRDDDMAAFDRSLQSILRQTDPSWELLLACSPAESDAASRWLEIDWRVRRVELPGPMTEAQALIACCKQATAVFAGLLSAGDMADDDLVKSIGRKLRERPALDVVYVDEATRLPDDSVGRRFHKPDWSPEHQQSVNMLGRFTAIRKKLLLALPQPISREDPAAEYELALAASAAAAEVGHIDELLYFRGSSEEGVPLGGFFAPHALEEARSALERHVRGNCSDARVQALSEGSLRVRWPEATMPVTLAILTGMYEKDVPGRGRICLATHFVRSIIEKSSARNYKILVVDDGFVPDDLRALLDEYGHASVTYPKQGSFSFAHKANFASNQVREGIVLLLNDDLEVIEPDWIQALSSQAARTEVGVAGARLLFPDGTLQHAGTALGFHGSAGHMFHKASMEGGDYAGFAGIDRNYSAVTGAVMAYRKSVFDEVGGFDLQFATDYNDLDFCLKCIEAGYRVVYTPAATLYHFHNSSLNRTHDNVKENAAFVKKWSSTIERDPYFSRHFQKASHDHPLLEPGS